MRQDKTPFNVVSARKKKAMIEKKDKNVRRRERMKGKKGNRGTGRHAD